MEYLFHSQSDLYAGAKGHQQMEGSKTEPQLAVPVPVRR